MTAVNAQTPATTSTDPPADIKVYAAGSLRSVMELLQKSFADSRPAATSPSFQFLYGPSGRLRERIEAGETAGIFASASPTHTEALVASGKLRSSSLFASNSLCLLAGPELKIDEAGFVDTLLSDSIRLGTSTPGADPSGDYTWEMFRKIGAERKGAFEALDRKALKLTGAEIGNQAAAESIYATIVADKRADVFITYCTNAREAVRARPALQSVRVPARFDVAAAYAIGLAPDAPELAREFLRFVLSQRAQALMLPLGFSPPPVGCQRVDDALKPAHAAWLAKAQQLATVRGMSGVQPPMMTPGEKVVLSLHSGDLLNFVKRAQGASRNRYGGAVAFVASDTGHVEVFVDRRAWIDVVRVRDQKVLESLRSDRWLGCAGVGKNLGFLVDKGERYELRLSEIEVPQVDVLIMPMASKARSAP